MIFEPVRYNRNSLSNRSRVVSNKSLFRDSKRAQRDAASAANLIAFIGLFIILYILFVPPAERDELLSGTGDTETPNGEENGTLVSYLINTQPGKLHYFFQDKFEHTLSPFLLKESKYSSMLAEQNPFTIRRSWFSNEKKSVSFSVPSVRDAVDLRLAFDVDSNPRGILRISINGNNFFSKELSSGMVNPIQIPKEFISTSNTLEFSLSPPDLKFWEGNEYQISGLVVTGDFIDDSTLENSLSFYLNDIEKDNVGESRLVFSPSCNRNTVGRLSIYLNSQSIYSSIPDCNTLNTVYFLPDLLDDENQIKFVSTEGEYMISLANVKTKITDTDYPNYYFELTDSTYNSLKSGQRYLEIDALLQDDERFKEAYVLVNSVKFFLNTRTNSYNRRIPFEVLEKGTNTVQIQPLNSFEIIRLRVALFEN